MDIEKALDYFMRYCNHELTKEEIEEQETIKERNKNRKITDNQYASCSHYEDELELSLDTH